MTDGQAAIGAPPAVINAVADALGLEILEQPITPDRVLRWLTNGPATNSRPSA